MQAVTGEQPLQAAQGQGIQFEVVNLPGIKQGFVLLPRRWVVAPKGHPSFAWSACFRRLARDSGSPWAPLPDTLAAPHFLAFAILMLKRFVELLSQSA